MKRLVVVTIGLAVTALAMNASMQGTSADETAIRQVLQQYVAALNKQDPAVIGSFVTADAEFVSSTGESATGRANIVKLNQFGRGGSYGGSSIKSAVTNIRFVKPDVAILNATFEIAGRGARAGTTTYVLVKQEGRWLITALRGSVAVPAK